MYICNIELLAIQSHLGAKFLCEFRYFALLRVQFSLELLPTRLQFADLFIEARKVATAFIEATVQLVDLHTLLGNNFVLVLR